LRESGTEPVIRVMVEAPTEEECEHLANEVVSQIYALGLANA
jgi:phosphoglucosamine mutase